MPSSSTATEGGGLLVPSSEPSLSGRLCTHILATWKGRALLATASTCAVGTLVWYGIRGRKLKGKKKGKKSRDPLRRAWRLAFKRNCKIVALAIPVGVGASILLSREVNTKFGAVARTLMHRDWGETFLVLYDIGLLTLPLVAVDSILRNLQSRLAELLRTNLEKSLRETYTKADYHTKQRVAGNLASLGKDTKELGTTLAEIYSNVVNAFGQILARPFFLGMHMGWGEFAFLLMYESVMRGFVLRRLLPGLDGLVNERAEAEGQYASAAGHVAFNASEIALIGGGGEVDAEILGKLGEECDLKGFALADAAVLPETLKAYMGSKLGYVAACITMLPAVYYTSDVSKTRTGEDPLVYLTNAVHDLIDLGKSLGLLFRQLGRVDQVTGMATRTLSIEKTAADALEHGGVHNTQGNAATIVRLEEAKWDGSFSIESLNLPVPRSKALAIDTKHKAVKGEPVSILLKDLTLKVKRGNRVLVRGENGAGKTTLLRLLTGRCNTLALKGTVQIPPPSKCNFLPAKNYFPPHATLPQILSYPERNGTYTQEDMLKALEAVGLAERLGGLLHKEPAPIFNPREQGLSDGEQRKLCLARVWIKKPDLAFLDEPISSIRGFGAYRAILARVPTVVTVSHNREKEFEQEHTHVLDILQDGSCNFRRLNLPMN